MKTNEEIFFKHAGCRKCRLKAEFCKCDVSELYAQLVQCERMMDDARKETEHDIGIRLTELGDENLELRTKIIELEEQLAECKKIASSLRIGAED